MGRISSSCGRSSPAAQIAATASRWPRLAGLPSTVVNRAKKILRQLEEEAGRPAPAVQAQEDQVSLTALSEGEVIDQLRRAQVDTLSPLEALNLLYELKKKLN